MEKSKFSFRLNSDGNVANVGNFDSDGANVGSTNAENPNSNNGVSFARSLCQKEVMCLFFGLWI